MSDPAYCLKLNLDFGNRKNADVTINLAQFNMIVLLKFVIFCFSRV